ncbi:hypothetical protein ACFX2I_014181 [Malus domestica]
MNQHVLCCTCLRILQGIIFISFICSSSRCGIFLSSSSQTPSTELTVQAAFFSACFFCTLSPRAASFFGSTAAVGDEYSRAVLGKNKDKGKDRENA